MIHFFPNEEFKEITLKYKIQLRYAISNYGRMISFIDDMEEGRLLKNSLINGFRVFRYKYRNEENKVKNHQVFVYHKVAEFFVPQPDENHKHIIHLDHDLSNDYYKNLKWVTREEMLAFQQLNPKVIEGHKKAVKTRFNNGQYKLTETKVMLIKQKIFDPNRKTRLKLIAKQFGITEMQLYRIKTGENWGHVQVNIPKRY